MLKSSNANSLLKSHSTARMADTGQTLCVDVCLLDSKASATPRVIGGVEFKVEKAKEDRPFIV